MQGGAPSVGSPRCIGGFSPLVIGEANAGGAGPAGVLDRRGFSPLVIGEANAGVFSDGASATLTSRFSPLVIGEANAGVAGIHLEGWIPKFQSPRHRGSECRSRLNRSIASVCS